MSKLAKVPLMNTIRSPSGEKSGNSDCRPGSLPGSAACRSASSSRSRSSQTRRCRTRSPCRPPSRRGRSRRPGRRSDAGRRARSEHRDDVAVQPRRIDVDLPAQSAVGRPRVGRVAAADADGEGGHDSSSERWRLDKTPTAVGVGFGRVWVAVGRRNGRFDRALRSLLGAGSSAGRAGDF